MFLDNSLNKKLIILNRDLLANRDLGTYVTCADEFEFIGDAIRDMQARNTVKCRLIMVENVRGKADHDSLSEELNSKVTLAKDSNHVAERLI